MIRLLRFLPRRFWSPRAWRGWKQYLHWRLETYGAYHPDGRLTPRTTKMLLRQFPSYYRWLGSLSRLRKSHR